MTTAAMSAVQSITSSPEIKGALRRLADSAREYVDAKGWSLPEQLKDIAHPDTAVEGAVVEGAEAALTGGNPATAAVKGAWHGASTGTKVAVVLILLLVVLLAPVVLVLVLLGLLVYAVVRAARS
jgi:hypothetical protein